jgi:hypothetical protein
MAKLHLGSGDDGLLLGCVELGAVARRRAPAAPAVHGLAGVCD